MEFSSEKYPPLIISFETWQNIVAQPGKQGHQRHGQRDERYRAFGYSRLGIAMKRDRELIQTLTIHERVTMYVRAGENPVCQPENEQDESLLRILSGPHASEVNLDHRLRVGRRKTYPSVHDSDGKPQVWDPGGAVRPALGCLLTRDHQMREVVVSRNVREAVTIRFLQLSNNRYCPDILQPSINTALHCFCLKMKAVRRIQTFEEVPSPPVKNFTAGVPSQFDH